MRARSPKLGVAVVALLLGGFVLSASAEEPIRFRVGDRVCVIWKAGVFKNVEGLPYSVVVATGHKGEVVKLHPGNGNITVKWDEQKWTDAKTGRTSTLKPFELTLHANHFGYEGKVDAEYCSLP